MVDFPKELDPSNQSTQGPAEGLKVWAVGVPQPLLQLTPLVWGPGFNLGRCKHTEQTLSGGKPVPKAESETREGSAEEVGARGSTPKVQKTDSVQMGSREVGAGHPALSYY